MNALYFILKTSLIWTVLVTGNDFQRESSNKDTENFKYNAYLNKNYYEPVRNKYEPVRNKYLRYKNGKPLKYLTDGEYAKSKDSEFREFYKKTSFTQDTYNDIEPRPPYFLAKAGRRGPPTGIYRNKNKFVKLIPGYTRMRATVLPSAEGNKIILSPEKIGHRIIIGDGNLPINADSASRNEYYAVKTPASFGYETFTKSSAKYPEIYPNNKCPQGNCEWQTAEILPEIPDSTDSKNEFAEEGSGEMKEIVRNIPLKAENIGDNPTIPMSKNEPWLVLANETNEMKPTGRFFSLFSDVNDSAPTCNTPKEEPGHCRNFGDCVLPDILSNFNIYLQYMCIIRTPVIGICCPDNPVVEILDPDETSVTNEVDNVKIQPSDGCGVNAKTRIVGGTIAKPNEWTWMVALMNKNHFFCGGVLINNWYVLTAAHCVMKLNIKELSVRLGEYNFSEKTKHQLDIPVVEIKRHANFGTRTLQNDIALLRLKQSVQFNRFVSTICLPNAGNDFANVNATVVGWGTVSFGGAASPILRQVTIPVWDNEECDRTYSFEQIDESFVCAGSPDDEQDACQGDSGGPLMSLTDQGRWQVIGLVSWGRRCGDPNFPGVYTRVTTYLDWIEENMQ